MEKTEGRKTTREEIAQRILVGCGVFGMLIGAGGALADRLEIQIPMQVIAIATAVGLVLIAGLSLVYWQMIDEAAREAHKFAWFWGGMAGTAVALMIGAVTDSTWLMAMHPDRNPAGWLIIGMAALLIAQSIGYMLAWAGWWLVRQR